MQDLSVRVISGKKVEITWRPPQDGHVDSYRLTIVPLSEPRDFRPLNMDVAVHDPLPISVHNLTAGASYEVKVFSQFMGQRSPLFVAANFTTKPNTPKTFIVWFRNETTLLILWQPPYPSGIFDQYKVSIHPPDALQSVLYVRKENDPPGPAQTSFDGLVPGRLYNITVQTVSNGHLSDPTESQYRTVPLPPARVAFNRATLSSRSFEVTWDPPEGFSEFDRYQVSLASLKNSTPKTVFKKDNNRSLTFVDEIEPGETYEVTVKAVSGNVISRSISGNVTARPLPVTELQSRPGKSSDILLSWKAVPGSRQDSFMIKYHELDAFNSDASVQVVKEGVNYVELSNLLAGRNYSISVSALSGDSFSEAVVIYQPTKPASPVIGVLEPISGRTLNISWKWDVTSKQDSYKIEWTRNDTKEKKEKIVKTNWLILEDLYPGAIYEIAVSAISHQLMSDPHSYFQTIRPRPPEGVHVSKHTNSSMLLVWNAPGDSLVDHYIARYRPTHRQTAWRDLGIVNTTQLEIKNLVAGEAYTVRVSAVANRAESSDIREIEQTMFPNAITNIKTTIDSHNMTFQWAAPEGVIDYYNVIYNPVGQPSRQESRQINHSTSSAEGGPARPGEVISVLIGDLKPGEEYSFRFFVYSFKLRSEGIGVQIRTSKCGRYS